MKRCTCPTLATQCRLEAHMEAVKSDTDRYNRAVWLANLLHVRKLSCKRHGQPPRYYAPSAINVPTPVRAISCYEEQQIYKGVYLAAYPYQYRHYPERPGWRLVGEHAPLRTLNKVKAEIDAKVVL